AFAVLALAHPARAEPTDADFIVARAVFQTGDRARLDALAGGFAGQLLEPYVAYWQLRLRLETATREEIHDYLKRWPDTPLADRLRNEWLKIVGMRRDWSTFALDY